jgi:hypothetical protein
MMSRIPALRRVKQEDHKFKASLVYIVRFVSGKKKKRIFYKFQSMQGYERMPFQIPKLELNKSKVGSLEATDTHNAVRPSLNVLMGHKIIYIIC